MQLVMKAFEEREGELAGGAGNLEKGQQNGAVGKSLRQGKVFTRGRSKLKYWCDLPHAQSRHRSLPQQFQKVF
jgi:hypothetical protein